MGWVVKKKEAIARRRRKQQQQMRASSFDHKPSSARQKGRMHSKEESPRREASTVYSSASDGENATCSSPLASSRGLVAAGSAEQEAMERPSSKGSTNVSKPSAPLPQGAPTAPPLSEGVLLPLLPVSPSHFMSTESGHSTKRSF